MRRTTWKHLNTLPSTWTYGRVVVPSPKSLTFHYTGGTRTSWYIYINRPFNSVVSEFHYNFPIRFGDIRESGIVYIFVFELRYSKFPKSNRLENERAHFWMGLLYTM